MLNQPGMAADKLSIKDGKVIIESVQGKDQSKTVTAVDLATGMMLWQKRSE